MRLSANANKIFSGRVIGLGMGKQAWVGGGLIAMLCMQAMAGPEGERVVNGSATFTRNGLNTQIQASNNTIIDYRSFNIGANESVNFIQPSAASRVLNRVSDSVNPTRIDGSLTANGIVYIVNSAGVYFGGNAVVNAAGLYSAAGQITNSDFLSNVNHFTNLTGTVSNAGQINAGAVALIGRQAENLGTIRAERGLVTMASGSDVFLGEVGGTMMVQVAGSGGETNSAGVGVNNAGVIDAPGGTVRLAAGDMYSLAIRMPGRITGRDVKLDAQGAGTAIVSGTIDASAPQAGGVGGTIQVLGDRVGLSGATLDASGRNGGGTILLGGDFQGHGDVRTASKTTITTGTTINADATERGNGGKVIVWSDQITRYHGSISSRGGRAGGDGGLVEVSGKLTLDFNGAVNTLAPRGRDGAVLLDPQNIVIQAAAGPQDGQVGAGDGDVLFAEGGAVTFTIGRAAIESILGDITLQATNNITVNTDLTLANQGVGETVTFRAGNDISINGAITTSGASINFIANDAGGTPTGSGSIFINNPLSTAGVDGVAGNITLDISGGTGSVRLGANLLTDGGTVLIADPLVLTADDLAIDTEQGDNNAAGAINLAGATLTSNAASTHSFTLNSSSGGGAGGAISLGLVDGSGGGFLNDLTLVSSGTGNGLITLSGNISLDSNGGDLASFTAIGGTLNVGASLTIDAEQGNDGDAGTVDLTGVTVSSAAFGNDLTINTSTAAGASNGGDVMLGTVDGTGGGFVNDLAINTTGTASAGAIGLNGDILLDGNGGDAASLAFSGAGAVVLNTSITIDTEQGNDGAGGAVTLGGASLSGDAPGRDLTINTATSAGAAAGGAITLGALDNTGGAFLNDVSLSRAGGSGGANGALTLDGDVSLDANAADTASFVVSDAGAISFSASRTIDTEQGDDGDGGAINLGAGTISVASAGLDLSLNSSTAAGGSTAGNITLPGASNAGGAFLNDLTVDASGGTTDGVISIGSDISLNANGGDVGSFNINSGSNVVLTGNVVIDTDAAGGATNAGDVTIAPTINGGFSLTIDTSADGGGLGNTVDLLDIVGGSTRLSALTVVSSGVGLDEAHVTGNISLTGDVIVLQGGATTVESNGVGGTLTLQPTAAGVSIRVGNAGAGTLVLSTTTLDAIGTFAGGVTIGRADGTSLININTAAFSNNTAFLQGGVGGSITVLSGASVTTSGGASLTFNAGSGNSGNFTLTSTGAINTGAGSITIISDSIDLLGGNNSISTTSTINLRTSTASRPIVIGAAGAATDFALTTSEVASFADGSAAIIFGSASASNPVTINSVTFVDSVQVQVPMSGGTIALNGDLVAADNSSISLESTGLTVSGGRFISIVGGGAGGDLTITGPINAASSGVDTLFLSAVDGDISLNGNVGSTTRLGGILVAASGVVHVGGNISVTGGGNVDFFASPSVVFDANSTIDTDAAGGSANAGSILFGSSSDLDTSGAFTVTLDATADGGGSSGGVNLGAVGANGPNRPTAFTALGSVVTINDNITGNGDITIGAATGSVVMGATPIAIDNTAGTNNAIIIRNVSGNGTISLTGDAGSALTVAGANVDTLNLTGGTLTLSGTIETDTAQNYSGVSNIVLAGDTSLIARDSDAANAPQNITTGAGNVITGARALVVNGNVVDMAAIGDGSTNPTSLVVTAASNAVIGSARVSGTTAVTSTGGNITFDLIDAGANTLTLAATAGSINEAGAGDAGVDLIAGTLNLSADAGIGGAGELDIETTAGSITAINSTSGDIVLTETDGVTLANLTNAGGNITVVAGGSILLDLVSAVAGNVSLTATGSINETGAGDSAVDILGNTVSLASTTGIGGAAELDLEVSAGTLNASATTSGDIIITETNAVTIGAINAAAGNVILVAGGDVSVGTVGGVNVAITTSGAITDDANDATVDLSAAGFLSLIAGTGIGTGGNGSLDFSAPTLTASSTTGNIDLHSTGATFAQTVTATAGSITLLADAGDVSVGALTAGSGNAISVTASAGAIVDNASDATADITTTGAVTLSAATGIGTGAGGSLDLDVGTLTSATSATGGITLNFLDGNSSGVTITSVDATTSGNITLTSTGTSGAFSVGTLDANDGSVSFVAANGDINIGTAVVADSAGGAGGTNTVLLNSTAGTLTLNGTVTADTGAVSLIGNDLAINAAVTTLGNVTLASSNGGSIGLGDATATLTLDHAELMLVNAANLVIQTTGGNGDITADGVLLADTANVSGIVFMNATGGDNQITFGGTASQFKALVGAADNGIFLNVAPSSPTPFTTVGSLVLDGDADAAVDGMDGVHIANGLSVRSADTISLSAVNGGITSPGAISLVAVNNVSLANALTATSAIISSGGTVTIAGGNVGTLAVSANNGITISANLTTSSSTGMNADADANGVGAFAITSGAAFSTTNSQLSLTLADLNIGAGTINTGSAATSITASTNAADIHLGGSVVGGDVNISGAELQNITASNLSLVAPMGSITVDGITAPNSANIASAISLEAPDPSATISFLNAASAFNGMVAFAGGGITINQNLTLANGLNLNADVDMDGAGDLTVATGVTVAVTTGNVALTAADLVLDGSLAAPASTARIERSANGTMGIADATGDMTIDKAELARIGATNLFLGGPTKTVDLAVDNVELADLAGVTGNVTLDATGTGAGITFQGAASTFRSLDAIASNGIAVNTDLTTTVGALALDADNDAATDGDDAITIAAGRTLTSGGALTLSATNGDISGGGDITLNAAGGVTINDAFAVGGALTVDADTDADGAGALTIAAGAAVTNTNADVAITAADLVLDGSISIGTGVVSISRSTEGAIRLGGTPVSGELAISGAELQSITANGLNIGGTTASLVTVDGITAGNSANISGITQLIATANNGSVRFENAASTFNTLSVTADDGVAVNVDVTTLVGDLSFNTNADNADDDNDQLTLAGDVTLTAGNDLQVAGTGIILAGASGTTNTFNSGTDGNVTLAAIAATNDVNVTINSENNVTLGSVQLNAGTLNATADADNDGTATLAVAAINAGSVTLSGGTDGNDTIDVFQNINGTFGVTLRNAATVRLNGGVNISVAQGAIGVSDGVGAILLSGADGTTNALSAVGGDISLAPVSATNNPNLSLDTNNNAVFTAIDLNTGNLLVNADVVAPGGSNISVRSGDARFNRSLTTSADGTVTINNSGAFTIDGGSAWTVDGAFSQTGAGPSSLNGSITTTGDTILFTGPVTLAGPVALSTGAGAGDINLLGAVRSDDDATPRDLTLTAGTGGITASGSIGDGARLGTLLVQSVNNATFVGSISADAVRQATGTGTTTFQDAIIAQGAGGISLDGSAFVFQGAIVTTNAGAAFLLANTGAADIQSGATMALAGPLLQTGPGAVSLAASITTSLSAISFTAPVTIPATINISNNGAGNITFGSALTTSMPVTIDGGTAGTGNVNFNGAVTTSGQFTARTGTGAITFANSVLASSALTAATTAGAVTFNGPLSAAGALSASTTSGTISFNSTVTAGSAFSATSTSANIQFGGAVNGDAAGSGIFTLNAGTGDIIMNSGASVGATTPVQRFAATGRNITVRSITTQGTAAAVDGDIVLTPDLTVTQTPIPLQLETDNRPNGLVRINGNLIANNGDITIGGAGRTVVPSVATTIIGDPTIANGVSPLPSFTVAANNGSVSFGAFDKLTVFGGLVLSGQTVSVSDIAALGALNINAGTINFRLRSPSLLLAPNFGRTGFITNQQDFGSNIVARDGVTLNATTFTTTGAGADPSFASATGIGVGLPPQYILATRADFNADALRFDNVALAIDAKGTTNTGLASALASALPRDTSIGTVAETTSVGKAEKDQLKQLRINSRDLTMSELLDFLGGRNIYEDVVLDPEAQPDDYLVTINRLPPNQVLLVLETYRNVFKKERIDPETGEVMIDPDTGTPIYDDRDREIRDELGAALRRFRAEGREGTLDPVQFRLYLERTPEEAAAYDFVESLQSFFDQLHLLGLGPKEEENSRRTLLGRVTPNGINRVQLEQAVMYREETASAQ